LARHLLITKYETEELHLEEVDRAICRDCVKPLVSHHPLLPGDDDLCRRRISDELAI
jgi:hypothetical protein